MGRREVGGVLCASLFTGGFAAMIGATVVPDHSAYFDVLMYGGGAAIALAVVGFIILALTAPKPKQESDGPIGMRFEGCQNVETSGNIFEGMKAGIVDIGSKNSRHENNTIYGDNYNVNNYGKQPFRLTQAILEKVASSVDRSSPVTVGWTTTVDSKGPAHEILDFLKSRGFEVIDGKGHMVVMPPLTEPVEVRSSSNTVWVDITK